MVVLLISYLIVVSDNLSHCCHQLDYYLVEFLFQLWILLVSFRGRELSSEDVDDLKSPANSVGVLRSSKSFDELDSSLESFLEVEVLAEMPVDVLQEVSVDELAQETLVLHLVHVKLCQL